jgi:hypothetical protein
MTHKLPMSVDIMTYKIGIGWSASPSIVGSPERTNFEWQTYAVFGENAILSILVKPLLRIYYQGDHRELQVCLIAGKSWS